MENKLIQLGFLRPPRTTAARLKGRWQYKAKGQSRFWVAENKEAAIRRALKYYNLRNND